MKYIGFTLLWSVSLLASNPVIDNFDNQIKELSNSIYKRVSDKKPVIAICQFVSTKTMNRQIFSNILEEELTVELANFKAIKIVERAQLEQVIKTELVVQTGALFEKQNIKKIGTLLGADVIITGSFREFGDSIRINVKLLDVSTGEITGSAKTRIALTNYIKKLLVELPDEKKSKKSVTSNERRRERHSQKASDIRSCQNHGGSGVFYVNTCTGNSWWKNGTDRKEFGRPQNAEKGKQNAYMPYENKSGAGFFLVDTRSGSTWWTVGKKWVLCGKPKENSNSKERTFLPENNSRGAGILIQNSTTGRFWWTNGSTWQEMGKQ